MSNGVNINGFLKSLDKYSERQQAAIARAIEIFAWAVIGRAQELAPVETGALKASATVESPVIEATNIFCTIGFNVEYAAAVHEILDKHHPQGQAKFLETAMREFAPKLKGFIEAELKKEFGT